MPNQDRTALATLPCPFEAQPASFILRVCVGGEERARRIHTRCGLKILVCMKQVPQKDAPLKLNESGTWIREDVSYEVNEPDAYALEEALRQKEKHGGEVVVITAGPAIDLKLLV